MEHFEVKRPDGVVGFITILEEFKHHYTGETIRVIRLEYVLPETGDAVIDGPLYITQKEYDELLEYIVREDPIA